MDHVVDRLSSDRSKRSNKRNNKKPGLRVPVVAAPQHFDGKHYRRLERSELAGRLLVVSLVASLRSIAAQSVHDRDPSLR